MTTWHPPIPARKLYSKEALDLGAGLALLVWCYDGIERDGHVKIELNKLTAEFGVSYRTIKEWWAALRDGPFFSKVEDHGRKGWRVWMADEWIDWHVMANNYPKVEGRNTALNGRYEGQNNALEPAQGPLKVRSRSGEGRNTALEQTVYKEDHHDPTPPSPSGDDDDDFVTRLLQEFVISETMAEKIATTGADLDTVIQSIRNNFNPKDPNSMGRILRHIARSPPEIGKPIPGPHGKPAQNGIVQTGYKPPADALSPVERDKKLKELHR